eukprot:GEMP01024827.1.p1 GENE.GEMP01024827.1~~GEMP01024827.1.p1  ORF type:complete len:639 (+),score=161.64 GEMP01024827.1:490-2406(+)
MIPLLFISLLACRAQHLSIPQYNYAPGDLEPFLSEAAIKTHIRDVFEVATVGLNDALRRIAHTSIARQMRRGGIEGLLRNIHMMPRAIRSKFRFYAGAYLNHDLFFRNLHRPESTNFEPEPQGELSTAIDRAFGSFQEFQLELSRTAETLLGPGWVWLIAVPSVNKWEVRLMTTFINDHPFLWDAQAVALLAVDMWEHSAGFTAKQRAEFLTSWWNLIDWRQIEEVYRNLDDLEGEREGVHNWSVANTILTDLYERPNVGDPGAFPSADDRLVARAEPSSTATLPRSSEDAATSPSADRSADKASAADRILPPVEPTDGTHVFRPPIANVADVRAACHDLPLAHPSIGCTGVPNRRPKLYATKDIAEGERLILEERGDWSKFLKQHAFQWGVRRSSLFWPHDLLDETSTKSVSSSLNVPWTHLRNAIRLHRELKAKGGYSDEEDIYEEVALAHAFHGKWEYHFFRPTSPNTVNMLWDGDALVAQKNVSTGTIFVADVPWHGAKTHEWSNYERLAWGWETIDNNDFGPFLALEEAPGTSGTTEECVSLLQKARLRWSLEDAFHPEVIPCLVLTRSYGVEDAYFEVHMKCLEVWRRALRLLEILDGSSDEWSALRYTLRREGELLKKCAAHAKRKSKVEL